ncbi:MAG: peptidoglycan DD-metalloendopeptidase family protein, partial [Lachnospiraceae bacterium]|nr:peptidoglycan DD-metalloendopeptidase family protein [Lachnospiraceae bacterium]
TNLTAIQTKVDQLKQEITDKEAEIDKTEKELEQAEKVQQAQYEAMKKRIQFMYERGNTYMLESLLQAGSFSEMLNKAQYIDEVSAYDRKKLEEYEQQTKLVETTRQALKEEKETLEAAKKAQEEEEAGIQSLIQEKAAQISSLEGQISDQESEMEETQAAIDQSTSEIAALESQVAADKAALAAQQKAYSGGAFTWPCPGYTYISSEFGYRVHPIYGTRKFHSGLDMAAPYGSPILAAADGTVVSAGYSASMGNYVMINHGGGLFTIYMHASSLAVSAGQSVSAGQQIASVGSTGNSTGPHLHFSVRLNGEYVNPRNYL